MLQKKGRKRLVVILVFILISSLISTMIYTRILRNKNRREVFTQEFKGVIKKKFRQRGDIIVYQNLKTNKEDEIYSSFELNENAEINDTIIKLPNSNNCIIKNGIKEVQVPCYFWLLDYEK